MLPMSRSGWIRACQFFSMCVVLFVWVFVVSLLKPRLVDGMMRLNGTWEYLAGERLGGDISRHNIFYKLFCFQFTT